MGHPPYRTQQHFTSRTVFFAIAVLLRGSRFSLASWLKHFPDFAHSPDLLHQQIGKYFVFLPPAPQQICVLHDFSLLSLKKEGIFEMCVCMSKASSQSGSGFQCPCRPYLVKTISTKHTQSWLWGLLKPLKQDHGHQLVGGLTLTRHLLELSHKSHLRFRQKIYPCCMIVHVVYSFAEFYVKVYERINPSEEAHEAVVSGRISHLTSPASHWQLLFAVN